ncbi:hypothetical protein HW532_12820 [Kaustia mangrovi]|uniref:Uncharacterized protein n=1 Tax=Kaustia mangrovi TaxID=2593653 RepID=A0A7S8HCD3_9HYPH|nr:hypothetical protein [Kaustia mangrovi]QPC43500.1 hypothetical protein HW532_12820 [Kaustia mangrovi]
MIEVKRDHTGHMHLFVNGVPINGAQVGGVQAVNGEMQVAVFIPTKRVTFGEVDNVVPMVKPAA